MAGVHLALQRDPGFQPDKPVNQIPEVQLKQAYPASKLISFGIKPALIKSADHSEGGTSSVYISEAGRQNDFVFKFKGGGANSTQDKERNFGFAVDSREAIDDIAQLVREDDIVFFEPDEYLPRDYLCGVRDPNVHSLTGVSMRVTCYLRFLFTAG
jgi:hypothetical protein